MLPIITKKRPVGKKKKEEGLKSLFVYRQHVIDTDICYEFTKLNFMKLWQKSGVGMERGYEEKRRQIDRDGREGKFPKGFTILHAIFHGHLEHECVLLNKGCWHMVKDLVEESFYTATGDDYQGGFLI